MGPVKILHTADWHIGQFKGPQKDGVNLRSLDTFKCLETMAEKAEQERPDLVCISGDIFHQEQVGPTRYSIELLQAKEIIDRLSKAAKFVIVMRGTPNHDGKGQFDVLKEIYSNVKNVEVITEPQVIQFETANVVVIPGFDKQKFRAKFPGLSADEENITWTKFISDMVVGMKAYCSSDKPSILMSHFTVPGCNMESGQTSFFTNFEPVLPREAIQTANYDAVLLGHIHRPQQLQGLDNVFYSGAINLMNFNDEGQERGFWIHQIGNGMQSEFFKTPYREFITMTMDGSDVSNYLQNGKNFLILKTGVNYKDNVNEKIVRVRFSCTQEQKKALNIPQLQNDLYDLGAFYVSEIAAEQAVEVTNRDLLSEESDPLTNLKRWLDEKCYTNTDEIVALAEPIIYEAMRNSATAEFHGVFKPVSIAVKNYRNYANESFDFADVSFCSINGVNGAGKSSLFMDAIVDALFEETREGDSKAWIRGTEEARSGSIEFTFEIGDKRFRVTRTRTKSGRATLNISQLDETGEWMNISKERMADTQKEIERILGMDSMTFRSCALIMQDQYGLFLQAKKDERIAILGNLLGLGIYGIMEMDTRRKLADVNREVNGLKEQIAVKESIISSKGNPAQELEELAVTAKNCGYAIEISERAIGEVEEDLRKADEVKARIAEIEATKQKAEAMSTSAQAKVDKLSRDEAEVQRQLGSSAFYRERAQIYQQATEDASTYLDDAMKYKEAIAQERIYNEQANGYLKKDGQLSTRRSAVEEDVKKLRSSITVPEDEIEAGLKELEAYEKRAAAIRVLEQNVAGAERLIMSENAAFERDKAALESEKKLLEQKYARYRQSEEFIKNSNCPVESGNCVFLANARKEVAEMDEVFGQICDVSVKITDLEQKHRLRLQEMEMKKEAIGFDPEEKKQVEEQIEYLSQYKMIKESQAEAMARIHKAEQELEMLEASIAECQQNQLDAHTISYKYSCKANDHREGSEKYRKAVELMEGNKEWAERAANIPVLEERLVSIGKEKAHANDELEAAKAGLAMAEEMAKGVEAVSEQWYVDKQSALLILKQELEDRKREAEDINMKRGMCKQRLEDIKALESELSGTRKELETKSATAAYYEILKKAFAQDGVPHQIVRNIIPFITDTANSILGQMTGGTMGVEFVMERTMKNKDGDKATLDVLINEYGKTTLPYASKSGGEKVKASLAIILALAEIKTTAAGIRLGMLFIDEPPFLDGDGAMAYVDSLETIRQRYPDIKIMAITHDDEMKARFMQTVTVIKTSEGSKVVY